MNSIQPMACEAVECAVVSDPAIITERYFELLGDESKLRAQSIESIYFPKSASEVSWALKDIGKKNASCVISAGRTGISGGAVPIGTTAIISLLNLNRPLAIGVEDGQHYVRLEPGVTLASVTGLLMKKDFSKLSEYTAEATATGQVPDLWFPVNPTETSAHIGGIVATNASGARTYRYGTTREWIRALTVVLPDGRLLRVRRGEIRARDGLLYFLQADGSITEIQIPDVVLPHTKATLGYPLRHDMDLIDLFIGSEGTLGVIVEVELALAPRPEAMIGVLVIAPNENSALNLVEAARHHPELECDAIEYFDPATFLLLHKKKQTDGPGSHIPDLPNWHGCGVYLEISGSEEQTEEACIPLEKLLGRVGLSMDDTWAAMDSVELAAQRVFRHAVPEAVNAIIGQRKAEYPQLHKVGTDMAVPDDQLRNVFAMYRKDLEATSIDSVIFGHIGNNHVHVNLLPDSMAELDEAKALYLDWAARIVAMGGAVAAEHGIGRMKKGMLALQFSTSVFDDMRRVRRIFDPHGTLAPGVLFDDSDT